MALQNLFTALADAFDGPLPIEAAARSALLAADVSGAQVPDPIALPDTFHRVMGQPDSHPVCRHFASLELPWSPPLTSSDPRYIATSLQKVHVEVLGPGGLVRSDQVRLGLYGMPEHTAYGIRTHPAEELYLMLAGQSFWKRGEADYVECGPGTRSHHPSMMPHANKTGDLAFMSVYVWTGDISTESYVYEG